jgi:C4-dicarboxylate-specific signal transduction histidine kinase
VIDALRNMLRRNEPIMKRIDLAEVTREVLQLVRTELMSTGINLNVFCEDKCYVIADKVLIQQVQLNLVMNAIEAMRESSDPTQIMGISVIRENENQVTFMVRDNGIGIASNQFLNLFDMFQTSKTNGVGLGLAISRSIIDSHRGSIWYERNVGGGLTFFFRLPLAESVPDTRNTVTV